MTDRWTDKLSEYLDDELSAGERQQLAEHLDGCAECAATLDELRQVVARAGALEDRAPASDLWPGIAARLHGPARAEAAPERPAGRRRGPSFTWPQLVAAGLAVALTSAALAWVLSAGLGGRGILRPLGGGSAAPGTSFVATADDAARYDAAISELRQALAQGRADLDPSTVRVLEQNLALIERSVEQSRAALAADPANPYLRQHLRDTMRHKLQLLQQATVVASVH